MKNFDKIFQKPRAYTANQKNVLKLIRKNLEDYSNKHITIKECLSRTGALTADLIVYHNTNSSVPKNIHDTLLVMAINYYAMLYLHIYTGNYTVSKKHTYNQLIYLVEKVLKEAGKSREINEDDIEKMICISHDYSRKLVDSYYNEGTEGCRKYLTASIYLTLLSSNPHHTVNRVKIDNIIRTLQAEKFLDGSSGYIDSNH